jgi:putative FmdB family regulatory protein
MPTYEYLCRACGHAFERFQKINDPPVEVCPECGEKAVEKQISAGAGLLFKGPGFYATDYRSPGPGVRPGKTDSETKDPKPESGGGDSDG